MNDKVYEEAYKLFCQHLQETVTEEMFEAMVLCATSQWWLVVGTEDTTLHIRIYRLTNPTIGKPQKLIINYHSVPLCDDVYSENDYTIATKTDENLFFLADSLSRMNRWCVPSCLLPLYDEMKQSYPHPSGYFAHKCEKHFLDLAIQEIEAECNLWTAQRHTWYQQVIDALLPLLKEHYKYVNIETNYWWPDEYKTRINLDSRKEKTLDVDLWEDRSILFVMSNDASCDIALYNAIDALNAAKKIVAFCNCRYL